MNSALVAAANECAGADDELWILGDLALGSLEDSLSWTRGLTAGRVVLVGGNHDRVHPSFGRGGHRNWVERYRQWGRLDEILVGPAALTLGTTAVLASHFPYVGADARSDAADRFSSWRPQDTGGWLLCGHVHGHWRQQGRAINVGVDAWAGRPVSEESLVTLIGSGPASLPAMPWRPAGVVD